MPDAALLTENGIIFFCLYLLSLLIVGIAGRIAQKENTLSDFYLSGRGLGLFVLFLTLYATQYSGHTLIGFPGKAYRQGYMFLMSVTIMMSVIGAYLFYAPKLQRLAKKYNFITVGDYIQHRFKSDSFTILITISCIVALANFILTNLKAIGYIVEAATGGLITFEMGIILLSVIIIIYETLGGMRSVAWTDAIQGVLLLIGVTAIFVVVQVHYGGLSSVAETLKEARPEFWAPPTFEDKNLWLSTILIFMFGVSVYPHAIQRIYSAKNSKTLKRSFQIMIFMPLVTTFFMFVVGLVGAARLPGVTRQGSDEVALLLLKDMANSIPGMAILVTLFITAATAAIMSTVDSALLAISSLFTQDIYRRLKPDSNQSKLTGVGKIFSWIVIAVMSFLAIKLPETIWRITEIKLELLCQVAPAIFLGINIKNLKTKPVLFGFLVGTVIAVAMITANITLGLPAKPLGIHAGIWGLAVNLTVIYFLNKKEN
ncbi:MAG: sodium:solute symporter family protein [Bacteroidetes bacterium]|nr:sodium:solute symporter family protein [Bacteroidota bacterium]